MLYVLAGLVRHPTCSISHHSLGSYLFNPLEAVLPTIELHRIYHGVWFTLVVSVMDLFSISSYYYFIIAMAKRTLAQFRHTYPGLSRGGLRYSPVFVKGTHLFSRTSVLIMSSFQLLDGVTPLSNKDNVN